MAIDNKIEVSSESLLHILRYVIREVPGCYSIGLFDRNGYSLASLGDIAEKLQDWTQITLVASRGMTGKQAVRTVTLRTDELTFLIQTAERYTICAAIKSNASLGKLQTSLNNATVLIKDVLPADDRDLLLTQF